MRSIKWCHFQWPWTNPNPVFKVTLLFDTKYLKRLQLYGHSCYRRRIGNRTQAFEWHQFQWPWQGLKYLKMSTTHREGRWMSRRARARRGGAERLSAEEVGSGEGRRSPSPVWGCGGIAPRKYWNLTVQICSFFHDFKTEIALPSVVFHSFTTYICLLRYDSVYSKKLTGNQLSLPHGINKKNKMWN